jgi:hypothetical protein
VNFCWTFTFSAEKPYDGTHLAFGETLDWRCHFKHVSLKVGSTTDKRAQLTGKGSRLTACCYIKDKKFPYRPTCDVSLLSWRASYVPCVLVTAFPLVSFPSVYLFILWILIDWWGCIVWNKVW